MACSTKFISGFSSINFLRFFIENAKYEVIGLLGFVVGGKVGIFGDFEESFCFFIVGKWGWIEDFWRFLGKSVSWMGVLSEFGF